MTDTLVWDESNWEGDIACPGCGGTTFKVNFVGPPGACAGGKITLECTGCHKSGIFYDDYA